MKVNNIRKAYTILVTIIPVLTVYKSLAPGIDLATFLFIAMSAFIIITSKGKMSKIVPLMVLLIYIVTSTLISLQMQQSFGMSVVLRLGKYIVLIFLIVFMGNRELLDVDLGFRTLKTVTLLAVTYIIIQTLAYKGAGILLPNAFLSLVSYEAYSEIDYSNLAKHFYRPTAFFIEPSSFCQYTLLYLCLSIFGWDKKKLIHNWKHAVFVSIGILLSGSGQGILLLFCIWAFWLLSRLVLTKLNPKKILILFLILAVGVVSVPVLMKSEILAKPLERVFTDNKEGGGNAFLGRMGGYMYFLMLPNSYKLIGMGYGNVPKDVYFNSLSYTLYCNGILGCILLLYLFGDIVRRGKGFQKVFALVYFGLITGATTFTAANICFYFSFIYNRKIRAMILNGRYPNEENIIKNRLPESPYMKL